MTTGDHPEWTQSQSFGCPGATYLRVDYTCGDRGQLHSFCELAGITLRFHQSNHEGELIDLIQEARQTADALIINPAGYSFGALPVRSVVGHAIFIWPRVATK